MNNKDTDFYKQLAGEVTRKLLILLGTLLVSHGWISKDSADGLTKADTLQAIVAFLLFAIPLLWGFAKQKYNVNAIREARDAPAGTPISVIKTETLSKHSLISSV